MLISELLSDERAYLIHWQLTQWPLNEVSLWGKTGPGILNGISNIRPQWLRKIVIIPQQASDYHCTNTSFCQHASKKAEQGSQGDSKNK